MIDRDEIRTKKLEKIWKTKQGKKLIEQEIDQLESMKRGLKKCERNRLNRLERATV